MPSFGKNVRDTDNILSEQSAAGQILAALIGCIARPSGIEAVFYAATMGLILYQSLIMVNRKSFEEAKLYCLESLVWVVPFWADAG